MIIRALTGMQKASTIKNVTSAFRAAGIVRKLQGDSLHSTLTIDRSAASAVRHWPSYQEAHEIEDMHNVQLVNHNPNYPRFKILSIEHE